MIYLSYQRFCKSPIVTDPSVPPILSAKKITSTSECLRNKSGSRLSFPASIFYRSSVIEPPSTSDLRETVRDRR